MARISQSALLRNMQRANRTMSEREARALQNDEGRTRLASRRRSLGGNGG